MEVAGTSICLVMKAVLLGARRAGRSRRLGLEQAAEASGDVVEAEQTRHDFLFGCNIQKSEMYDEPWENEAYSKLFATIFNFATLGIYWNRFEPRRGLRNRMTDSWKIGEWNEAEQAEYARRRSSPATPLVPLLV